MMAADAWARARKAPTHAEEILVASLEDVIRSKEAAGRQKDRLALPRLRRVLDRLGADE